MLRNITIPFQITKVDEEQRRVWGVATSDALDSQGDILDYEASKKAVTEWMKVGNIREMHDAKKAVGKAFDAKFDDVNKTITVGSYISQSADGENTWQKVKEKILTGYSVGGQIKNSVLDKVHDAATGVEETINRVTDWSMSELSLVDNPANPTAQIVMIKSKDGKSIDYIDKQEVEKFLKALDAKLAKRFGDNQLAIPTSWWAQKYQNNELTKDQIVMFNNDQISRLEKRDFTDDQRKAMADKGQALPDGSFPIANKTDLANAIKAVGRAKDPAAAKAHIIKRAKTLGATDMLPPSWTKSKGATMKKYANAGEIVKDFYGAMTVIDCAISLQWFLESELQEGDEPTSTAVQAALDALKTAAQSELAELEPDEVLVMANAIEAGKKAMDLAKSEGRIRKAGEAVVDSDPRDANANTVPPTVPKPPSGGTVVPKVVAGAKPNTGTLVNKALIEAGFTEAQAAAIEKITATTALPDKPPRKANPAADSPEAKDDANDDEHTSDSTDGAADAPTEGADNAPADGEASNAPVSAIADGAADAPTPEDGSGGGTATAPKAAEPAAAVSDTAKPISDSTATSDDKASSNLDAPTEMDHSGKGTDENNQIDEGTDDGDDDSDDDNKKSSIAILQKSISDVQSKLAKFEGQDDLAKAVGELSELVKTQLKEFDQKIQKFGNLPQQVKVQNSYTEPVEVIKGRENNAVDGEKPVTNRNQLTETEIVGLFKRADDLIAHPGAGTPQERGEVMRKLWGIDRTQYAHLLK